MAFSKSDIFTSTEQSIASIGRAFGHPARVRILRLLQNNHEYTSIELSRFLPLARTTVAQHLKVLIEVGLVDYTIRHPKVYYFIHTDMNATAQELLDLILAK